MMNKLNKIAKLFFLMLLACSVLNITSCDKVEEVSLDAGLQSISVTKMPDKIKYSRADQTLDKTGLEVTAHYRSGYSKLIDHDKLTFTGFRSTEGYYTASDTITITYDDQKGTIRQCSFQITYSDLANISIISQPEKTRYTQNSPLDLTGLIINATYQDNSSQPVFSPAILEMLRLITWGTSEETVLSEEEYTKIKNYRGRDENNEIVNLTIPLMYEVDENENFVRDENGNRILTNQLEIIGFDDTFYGFTEGQKQVLIKYTEIADGYFPIERETAFNVKLASLSSLSMTSSPNKSHYTKNSVLNFDGMTLRANFSDGSTETVFSPVIYQDLDLTETKKNEINNFIGGTGKSLSIPLEWKTDSNGNVLFKDGGWCPAREIVFMDYDSVAPSTSQQVKVRYVDNWGNTEQVVEAQFGIQYEVLNGIIVGSDPTKRKYKRGESFDFTGLTIRAQYTDGKTDDLFSDEIYKNLTTLTEEDRLKIEAYKGRDGDSIVPLKIPLEWQRDENGTVVTDGDGNKVPLREIIFEGFDSAKFISSQEVTITLKDYSEASPVLKQTKIGIGYIDIAGIQVSANPFKLKYFPNEPLDLSGLIISAQYEDNSMEKIFTDEIFDSLDLTAVERKAITEYKGDIQLGEAWFKQLDSRSTDTSNRCTIPLAWKRNLAGQLVDNDGNVITASDEKVCVTGIVVLGFDSTEYAGSQNVRLRFIDNSGYGTFEKEVSFQITYKTLSSIQVTSLPKYTGDANEAISFDGINVRAQYSDGSSKIIFSNEKYAELPDGYKPASLGNKYTNENPLEIILEKDKDGKVIRQINFAGFDTTGGTTSQTVTVTYKETNKADTISVQTQYQLRKDHLRAISSVTGYKQKYKMDSASSDDTVGGLNQTETKRTRASEKLSDIADWHFDVGGMKITLSYNNGDTKELTFINSKDAWCYGTSTKVTEAYVLDANGKLMYMQRWAKETDSEGNRYKIKITGFDPIAAFKSAKSQSVQQALNISFTEGDITVSAQITITYEFGKIFKPTETIKTRTVGSFYYYSFGDYPKSEKKDFVEVNNYVKEAKGLFEYQLGSDGYLYCPRYQDNKLKYFKVEPIEWRKITGSNYYYATWVVDTVPYYTGKKKRQNKKTDEFQWTVDGKYTYGTVNSVYDIGDGSFIYSTLRNWLNGDNINGDATYNGKGFIQTAFTPTALALLKDVPIEEMFNATIYATSNNINGNNEITSTKSVSAEFRTVCDYSSVKAFIPCDINGENEQVSRKYFNYNAKNTNYGVIDRLITYPHERGWSGKGAIYNSFNFCKFANYANLSSLTMSKLSDFAGDSNAMWLASDVHCSSRNENKDGLETTLKTAMIKTHYYNVVETAKSTEYYGVTPIILIE